MGFGLLLINTIQTIISMRIMVNQGQNQTILGTQRSFSRYILQTMKAPTSENQDKIEINDFATHDVSGLSVRRDYTLPLFGLGALIFMVGVVQGMYCQHRRIWVHPKGEGILLAAHNNKNWFGIKKD